MPSPRPLALVAALALAGDPGLAQTTGRAVDYACDGGVRLTAVYRGTEADLVVGGRRVALRPIPTASGARYGNGTLTWFTKEADGFLEDRGRRVASNCRALAAAPAGGLLEGRVWTLIRVVVAGRTDALPARGAPTLAFEKGAVRAHSGCNLARGRYLRDGARLAVGPLAATRRACPTPEATALENRYLRALEGARTAYATARGREAGALAIKALDGTLLVFRGP